MRFAILTCIVLTLACGSDNPVVPVAQVTQSPQLTLFGMGRVAERFTAEVWVQGNIAYTTTWGNREAPGNAVKIWNVSGDVPTLVDSLIVPSASTLGDVQASDDGQLLIVATEFAPGSIMIYSLANPVKPQLISRYTTALTNPGVHTAEVQRVNGKLYAFLCIDPGPGSAARLVIVDLSNPAAPTQVFTAAMGRPFVHDLFVRDGILMTALWDDGVTIWDIGGAGGGTISNPIALGNVKTVGGEVHNIWWFHNSVTGEKRYAFVGEEAPGAIGLSSSGDIHVIDVSNLASPREVAFFHVDAAGPHNFGAGPHNFSVDESRGILYAAYYNAGVRAIDVTGDLSSCAEADKGSLGRCDLAKMGRELAHWPNGSEEVFVWGVHLVGLRLYASDMLNGLWKLGPVSFPPD